MIQKRISLVFRKGRMADLDRQIAFLEEDQKPQITAAMKKVIARTKRNYSRKSRVPLVEQVARELQIEERRGKIIKEFLVSGDGFESKTENSQRTQIQRVDLNGRKYGIIPMTKESRVIVARDILREMGEEAHFCYGFDKEERFEPLVLVRNNREWKMGFGNIGIEQIEIISDRGINALCKMEAGVELFFDLQNKTKNNKKPLIGARFAGHLVFEGSDLWPQDRWSKIRSKYERLLSSKFFDKEQVIREIISRVVPRDIREKVKTTIKPDFVSVKIPDCTIKPEIERMMAGEFRLLRHFGMHLHSKEECRKIN